MADALRYADDGTFLEPIALSSFARPWQRRCRAVLDQSDSPTYYGRCELKHNHSESHTIERGMEIVCWAIEPRVGRLVDSAALDDHGTPAERQNREPEDGR